jgi:hypothetical protein
VDILPGSILSALTLVSLSVAPFRAHTLFWATPYFFIDHRIHDLHGQIAHYVTPTLRHYSIPEILCLTQKFFEAGVSTERFKFKARRHC